MAHHRARAVALKWPNLTHLQYTNVCCACVSELMHFLELTAYVLNTCSPSCSWIHWTCLMEKGGRISKRKPGPLNFLSFTRKIFLSNFTSSLSLSPLSLRSCFIRHQRVSLTLLTNIDMIVHADYCPRMRLSLLICSPSISLKQEGNERNKLKSRNTLWLMELQYYRNVNDTIFLTIRDKSIPRGI